MLPPDGLYLFGRVIDIDVNAGDFGGSNLIYIYKARSSSKGPVPALQRGQLLVPPLMTNDLPWRKGYLEKIAHREISPLDRLPQHCFVDSRGWYFDEKGNKLSEPVEPVGVFGLHSYRTIDDAISRTLGIAVSD